MFLTSQAPRLARPSHSTPKRDDFAFPSRDPRSGVVARDEQCMLDSTLWERRRAWLPCERPSDAPTTRQTCFSVAKKAAICNLNPEEKRVTITASPETKVVKHSAHKPSYDPPDRVENGPPNTANR